MVRIRVPGAGGEVEIQLVFPRNRRPYPRLAPPTIYIPSKGIADTRQRFGAIASLAKQLTDEEVARIVGGRVYTRNMILMPDGRILPKTAALLSALLRGYKSRNTSTLRRYVKMPAWQRRLGPDQWVAITQLLEAIQEAIAARRRGVIVVPARA